MDQVPVIVNECLRFDGFPFLYSCRWRRWRWDGGVKPLHGLGYPAAAVIVGVEDTDCAVGEGCRGDEG